MVGTRRQWCPEDGLYMWELAKKEREMQGCLRLGRASVRGTKGRGMIRCVRVVAFVKVKSLLVQLMKVMIHMIRALCSFSHSSYHHQSQRLRHGTRPYDYNSHLLTTLAHLHHKQSKNVAHNGR
jgi:hypothetical protein